MKIGKYPALLACAAITAALLACSSFSFGTTAPTVSNIRMATDQTGKAPTSTYSPGATFYVFADLSGLSKGQVVQAKWYAVSAQGVEPNAELNTSSYTYETGVGFVSFQLTTNDGSDWPTGSYRVELYLDGAKVGEQGFTVQ
jgi:hypothetical protein